MEEGATKVAFLVDSTLCGTETFGQESIPLSFSPPRRRFWPPAFSAAFFAPQLCIERLPHHCGMQLGDGYSTLPLLHLSSMSLLHFTYDWKFDIGTLCTQNFYYILKSAVSFKLFIKFLRLSFSEFFISHCSTGIVCTIVEKKPCTQSCNTFMLLHFQTHTHSHPL